MNKKGQGMLVWAVAIFFGFLLIMIIFAFIPPIQIPFTEQKFHFLSPKNANHVKVALTIIAWFLIQGVILGSYYYIFKFTKEKGGIVLKKILDLGTSIKGMFK